MKRHTLVSGILNVSLVVLASSAWVQAVGGRVSLLDIASLLGVIAFSLMYVHYAADAIAPKQDDSKDIQYIVSRIAVLIAIIAHPFIVNLYLLLNGYGAPPDSYEKLVGEAWPVLLGWAALAAFIAFELRGKLKRFERHIFHANIVAMFLILMHGFLIGMVIMSSWFIWVWWLLLITFTIFVLKSYAKYYMNNNRFYIAAGIVILLAIIAGFIGFNELQQRNSFQDSSNEQTNSQTSDETKPDTNDSEVAGSTITREQLKENDGKDGNKCWIAVDGVVYDPSSSREWVNGEHVPSGGRAKCGEDLTAVISQSPHGKSVLGEIEKVGTLSD